MHTEQEKVKSYQISHQMISYGNANYFRVDEKRLLSGQWTTLRYKFSTVPNATQKWQKKNSTNTVTHTQASKAHKLFVKQYLHSPKLKLKRCKKRPKGKKVVLATTRNTLLWTIWSIIIYLSSIHFPRVLTDRLKSVKAATNNNLFLPTESGAQTVSMEKNKNKNKLQKVLINNNILTQPNTFHNKIQKKKKFTKQCGSALKITVSHPREYWIKLKY